MGCCWSCGCYSLDEDVKGKVAIVTGSTQVSHSPNIDDRKFDRELVTMLQRDYWRKECVWWSLVGTKQVEQLQWRSYKNTVKWIFCSSILPHWNLCHTLWNNFGRWDFLYTYCRIQFHANIICSFWSIMLVWWHALIHSQQMALRCSRHCHFIRLISTRLAVNHLGHFKLTLLLMDLLIVNTPSRIVNVSSIAHYGERIPWSQLPSYSNGDAYEAWCVTTR